jgi:hypothetical protein
MIGRRPGNRATANAAPNGNPSNVASATAERLTSRLRATMPTSAGSPEATSAAAAQIASPIQVFNESHDMAGHTIAAGRTGPAIRYD